MYASVSIKAASHERKIQGDTPLQLLQEAIKEAKGKIIERIKKNNQKVCWYSRETGGFNYTQTKGESPAGKARFVTVRYIGAKQATFSVRTAESMLKRAIHECTAPIAQIDVKVDSKLVTAFSEGRFQVPHLEGLF